MELISILNLCLTSAYYIIVYKRFWFQNLFIKIKNIECIAFNKQNTISFVFLYNSLYNLNSYLIRFLIVYYKNDELEHLWVCVLVRGYWVEWR